MKRALFAAFNRLAWQPAAASGREGASWQMLSPWGVFPNSEGDQVITADSTAPMVAALNARDEKAGGKWPGLPIYEDHPDTIDPAVAKQMGWTNTARIGHFWRAEARDDGLYVLQAWNAQGAYNGANGIRRYPSGYWYIKSKGRQVLPTGFRSIGMTEEPNIKGVSAWNTSTDAADGDEDTDETTDPNIAMIKRIAKLLGLPETTSPEDLEAAIAVHVAKPEAAALNSVTAQVATEKQRADAEKLRADKAAAGLVTATGEKAALNARVITLTLDRALETGRITKGERKDWETKAALNSETACADVLKLRPRLNLGTLQLDRATQAKAAMNSASAQLQINDLVKAALPKHRGNTQAAYNAVMKDPANAKLVAAISGSAESAAE